MSAAAPKLTPGADAEAARYLSERVEARSGIHLPERKNELLLSRVTSRIMALGFPSITEYRRYLEALPADHEEWQALINELTTNKTDFFRESAHFEYLEKQFLPRWESEHGPGEKLNAWSAACSTGEEAYTLAMVLDRYFGQADRFHVLGSDVDTEALAFARNGVYPSARLEPVPDSFRERGIQFGKDALRGWGKIATPIYQRVSFEQLNLATERPRVAKGPFDVIFCRNVFIYFQRATIERAVASLYEAAAPGALLAIGHSENLQEIKNPWHSVGPALWEKTAGTKRASARKAEPVAAAQAAPKRVLIVDDSKTVTQLLRKVLSQDPSLEVVAEVNHPSEVEAAIRKYRPNVMTLDIHMPDMDGCEVLERILPTYPIPTVMISSISREEGPFVLRALELGAVDYIQKPSFNELDAIAPNLVRTVKGAAEARVKCGFLPEADRDRLVDRRHRSPPRTPNAAASRDPADPDRAAHSPGLLESLRGPDQRPLPLRSERSRRRRRGSV
jgi:chemotaxis protein methyltransferase CheR